MQQQSKTQSQLMINGLYLAAFSAALFASIHHPDYNTRFYGFGLAVFVLLIVAVRLRKLPALWATHAMLGTAWTLVVWAMVFTGGLLSTKLVWLSMLIPAAYLVLPVRAATTWVAVMVLTVLVMAGLHLSGALSALATRNHETVWWSWLNRVQVLCMMLVCVHLYRYQHQRVTEENEAYNQALEETSRKLQQVQHHKESFLAAVGHELRTPMNAILGLNGSLRTLLAANPQDGDMVDHIRASTEQLLQVIQNTLDFSRLQAHRLVLVAEPFDLEALLQSCVQSFDVAAQSKGLLLHLDAHDAQGVWVHADAKRLQQIIHHLLDNAVRFSQQGHIHVRAMRQADMWRFEVQDAGVGLTTEQQSRLFQGLERAERTPHRLDGRTGLGLAICEQLVRLQNGRIGVESQIGEGACFWFELALPQVATPAFSTSVDLAAWNAHPWRIVLVDDNELNRVVATMLLKKRFAHATIHPCASAKEALSHLATQAVDVVLMDILMPEMDGMAATRALRAQPGPNAHTPVLAMTAIHQPEDRQACLAAGMQGMVCKPLRDEELLQGLRWVWPDVPGAPA